jgi:hypothetical protein
VYVEFAQDSTRLGHCQPCFEAGASTVTNTCQVIADPAPKSITARYRIPDATVSIGLSRGCAVSELSSLLSWSPHTRIELSAQVPFGLVNVPVQDTRLLWSTLVGFWHYRPASLVVITEREQLFITLVGQTAQQLLAD